MTKLRSAFLLLLAMSLPCGAAFGQVLSSGVFWDYPTFIIEPPARYFRAGTGAGRVVIAWQESSYLEPGGVEGQTYISLRTSTDGVTWREYPRAAGPFTFVGKETRIYSLAVDDRGTAYLALSVDKQTVAYYRLRPNADSLEELSEVRTDSATVAPTISVRSDGELIFFATQETGEVGEDERTLQTTAIVYSLSSDGIDWTLPKPFVLDETVRVSLHFLPRHSVLEGTDYVVFQARITDPELNRQANQLYIKRSDDGGSTWSTAKRLTDYPEFTGNEQRPAGAFNNENAFLYPLDDRFVLTWERAADSSRPQIYYGEVLPDGTFAKPPELVTQGVRTNRSPRAFGYNDRVYLLWFDNRAGADHVILGVKNGILWTDSDLSESLAGTSQFGVPFILNDELFFLWENRREQESSIVYLSPDQSAASPTVDPANFESGRRYPQDRFAVSWNLPEDSSRIEGFSVVWDQNPDTIPPREIMFGINDRYSEAVLEEDGTWYVHVSARDRAGNWSAPTTTSVIRDTTPPEGVVFDEPEMDDNGFLISNTYDLSWSTPSDEDVAGYSYRLQYLDTFTRTIQYTAVALKDPSVGVNTVEPRVSFRNYDNGLWALSVAAIDTVGNVGEPQTLFFRLDKYIPVTYITSVGTREDDLGRIEVNIIGRGFAAGGAVRRIILDEDRQGPPWDYEYRLINGSYDVANDRSIRGLVLEGLSEGDYWIAVEHPTRGVHFAPSYLAVKPMGKVKFGDFDFRKPMRISLSRRSRLSVSFNMITVFAIMAFLAVLILLSSGRLAGIVRDGRLLRVEVQKLLREELPTAQRMERISQMKKKGLGLRLKFSLVTVLLVISTVLIVAFPLVVQMTNTQSTLLGEGLQEKANVMVEGAVSGAKNFLPDTARNAVQLALLPRQTEPVQEAEYMIITGESQDGAPGYQYIWAQNDPEIAMKISTPDIQLGTSILEDQVSELIGQLRADTEARAIELVEPLRQELTVLQEQQTGLIINAPDDLSEAEIDAGITKLGDEIQSIREQMEVKLIESEGEVLTLPEYDPAALSEENLKYMFYKPVVFLREGDNSYFHGVVRLSVSIEKILDQITAARNSSLIATGIISLIAIGIGVASALVLSSIIIKPIRTLANAVKVISDTEDKEELKGHIINIKTRDEIADLAETVNEMTTGLAAAAAANKQLIIGKETQKMFTPLVLAEDGKRKLTTAAEVNDFVEIFGYYEGALGVSGDYFDYTKLDDKHYAIIKCDVAGKGVPASLIMVEVATIFLDYFSNWNLQTDGVNLEKLVYRINDLVEQRGFEGRFAALLVALMNIETGVTYLCNAGDKFLHVYSNAEKKTVTRELNEAPATGQIDTFLVEMSAPYKQIPHTMQSGDVLLLFTDGSEEDQRHFRDSEFNVISCEEPGLEEGQAHGNHNLGERVEEFGLSRIYEIIDAVMSGGGFTLEKYHNPIPDEVLEFDFSTCTGTAEDAVLAIAAVDKVFRLIPNPALGPGDRLQVDVNIDRFLQEHFVQYKAYFRDPTTIDEQEEYVFFPRLAEDSQYDDLTILALRKV